MYNEFFGFRESPFSVTPNTQFFYTNDLYQEAFANLCYGIEWSKGLIVVSGEVGTGKTTLLYKTMRSLKATTHPVFLSYDQLTYGELLRHLSTELGLSTDGQDRLSMATRLREHLVVQQKKGHILALLIDEAQSLSDEMFEGIRFLSNFETEKEKLLQIVLSGQPELALRLDQPGQRHLKQRIFFHCRLTPLKNDEVGRYIEFRLQKAGYESRQLFVPEAIAQVASYSQGVPRLINIICDNALLLAFALSRDQVREDMIEEVVRDLGLKDDCQFKTHSPSTLAKTEGENWLFRTKRDIEQQAKFVAGEPSDAQANGSREPAELEPKDAGRRTTRQRLMAIAACMILIALAGAVGVLSSKQNRLEHHVRDVHQKDPLADARSNPVTQDSDKSQVAVLPAKTGAPTHGGESGESSSDDANSQLITPEVEHQKQQSQPKTRGKKEVVAELFEVVGPFSFVRRTPRADADIIATLQPATRLNVLSVRGDYLQVQAFVEGRRVRGFVHREDAFFERTKK